ncbi:MAG TPA: TetR family transcriptional regulator [Mycobacteriales bacterium]|jgi:AcrR family transcriptional regulator|nr:TetR family transcriptional regulator [Mycobacteriales bacterium]
MRSSSEHPGLRERKKAKTRVAIQQHAMRLFSEQGYAVTTVDQIAAAAEISPSTFFRYFRTKEDVVLTDEYDPLLVEVFRTQPADLTPIQAMRATMTSVLGGMSAEDRAAEGERSKLLRSTPELQYAYIEQLTGVVQMLSKLVAERVGRPAEDIAVRSFAGALIGVGLAAHLTAPYEQFDDYLAFFDQGLAQMEAGFPL